MNPDSAKILAMLALGGGCLFIGLLPAFITRARRRRQQFAISNLLCFGAGVLLATSLVHMLPEVRENLGDSSEVIYCIGFFIVYVVDELVHAFFGEAIRHSHGARTRSHSDDHRSRQPTYGSDEERRILIDR